MRKRKFGWKTLLALVAILVPVMGVHAAEAVEVPNGVDMTDKFVGFASNNLDEGWVMEKGSEIAYDTCSVKVGDAVVLDANTGEEDGEGTRCFTLDKNYYVVSVENTVVTLAPVYILGINSWDSGSNFKFYTTNFTHPVKEMYNPQEGYTFKGFATEYNGVPVYTDEENPISLDDSEVVYVYEVWEQNTTTPPEGGDGGEDGGDVEEPGDGGIDYDPTPCTPAAKQEVVAAAAPVWVPTTPQEKQQYACVGTEKVSFTATTEGTSVKNAFQGTKCFDSFNAVLGKATIARTYNIYPKGASYEKPVWKTDKKQTITMDIPKSLLKDGRTFKMICVTEGGKPYIYNNVSKEAGKIQISTDTFGAFALIWEDAK